MHTIWRVLLTELPSKPSWVFDNPLPPNRVVLERLLSQNVPTYVEDFRFNQRAEAQVRYSQDLRIEVVMKLTGSLAVDQYWTERVSLLPDSTFWFLQWGDLEVFTGLLSIDVAESGLLSLLDSLIGRVPFIAG